MQVHAYMFTVLSQMMLTQAYIQRHRHGCTSISRESTCKLASLLQSGTANVATREFPTVVEALAASPTNNSLKFEALLRV